MSLTATVLQQSLKAREPERYTLLPTPHVPNSPMPILVYRDVLPYPREEKVIQAFIEPNGWFRAGIVWPAVYRRHFHPNLHECYAILSGASDVLMGLGAHDEPRLGQPPSQDAKGAGLVLTLREGDVIVHPAGTAHSNISDQGRYRYLSFFPNGSPRWISKDGDEPLDLEKTVAQTMAVPMPEDPVTGGEGHLGPLWKWSLDRYLAGKNE